MENIKYFPQFISEAEEANLLKHIYAAPKPKWRQLSNRRLQNWGGFINDKNVLIQEKMPLWLDNCVDKIMLLQVDTTFPLENRPNHVLINEYLPGQGILVNKPHTDGPAFFPMISTITLGSHAVLTFYEENDEKRQKMFSLLLEPRSLILISGEAYKLLHGIDEVTSDTINLKNMLNYCRLDQTSIFEAGSINDLSTLERTTRVSLTIRNVPLKRKLFGIK